MHDLIIRHSVASFLINKGVSLYVVQDLLGHAQIKTTQRYAHLTQETLQDAAEVAAAFIDQAAHGERSRAQAVNHTGAALTAFNGA